MAANGASTYPAGNGMVPGAGSGAVNGASPYSNGDYQHSSGAVNGVQHKYDAPAAHPANKLNNAHDTTTRRSGPGRMKNLLLALMLAIATALAAAPAAGYKSGWAFYRRRNYLPPQRFGIPIPITLRIWVGWIKGTNSVTNLLHRARPAQVKEYTYLRDVRESGQVIGGLAIAFLLLSALVAFLYLLACLLNAVRSRKSATTARFSAPKGLAVAGLVFGILNMLWACACYIVVAVGTAIYTRRNLNATYVCWPDWCFFLAFFSGVFWLIASALALTGRRSSRSTAPHGTTMTHNTAYDSGAHYDKQPRAAV